MIVPLIIVVFMAVFFGFCAGTAGKRWYVWAFLGALLSFYLYHIGVSAANYLFHETFGYGPGSTPENYLKFVIPGIAISVILMLIIGLSISKSWRTESSEISCPSCGSQRYSMGLPLIAIILIIISLYLFYSAFDTSLTKIGRTGNFWLSCILFGVGFGLTLGNKKAICLDCRHKFFLKDDEIYVCCPSCKRNLDGVTKDMIGDTGVCPKCKTEFEIKPGRRTVSDAASGDMSDTSVEDTAVESSRENRNGERVRIGQSLTFLQKLNPNAGGGLSFVIAVLIFTILFGLLVLRIAQGF